MVARFGFIKEKKGAWEIVKTSNGPWMQYTDHEQALAENVALYEKQVREALERLTDDFMFRLSEKDAAYQQLMAQAVRFAESVADYDPYHGGKRKKDAKAFLKEHQS